MSSTTFRAETLPVEAPTAPEAAKSDFQAVVDNPVPYLDYEKTSGKPFSVEYFGLGPTWDSSVGGYPSEIKTIETYFRQQIENGELTNSVESFKKRIKEIEKINNLKGEDRVSVKIGTIASYLEFLMKKEDIMANVKKYGSY